MGRDAEAAEMRCEEINPDVRLGPRREYPGTVRLRVSIDTASDIGMTPSEFGKSRRGYGDMRSP
jgi:hypothetical protein